MGSFLVGFVLPLLLLAAGLMNWSLIGLIDVVAFLIFQFNASKLGFHCRRRSLLLWATVTFSLLVIVCQSAVLVFWATHVENWSTAEAWWIKLFGFLIVYSWRSPVVIYFLVLQLLAVIVALLEIYWSRFHPFTWQVSGWGNFFSFIEHLGYRTRNTCCLLLPAVQLVVGISHPSWISLPFFIGSCVGLVDWSLTSNFLGLFRWWRALQLYAGVNIGLLYMYQLPAEFFDVFRRIADFIGLYWISPNSEWTMICSGISLLLFYIMLCSVKSTLEEMEFILSSESHLTEQLLPSKYSFFIRESRSGVRHTNMLLRGSVFRTFSINFFTYGFPVPLFALSFWSFHLASICAFGLLAYVGYNIYAFPSLFRLHRLNGLLLVFILLWALGTYIFNVAFSFLKWELGKDMDIWEMVGLWHYPIPGFFLLAQFCLGVLVALGNLVNNSVFLCLSEEYGQPLDDSSSGEVEKDTKVLIVATVAWGLRKCSRAITLALIFLIAMKPGFIHAVYMIFFLIYLLSHYINRRIRQSLILLCEAHFALVYVLRISLISEALEKSGSLSREILSQLGLLQCDSWEFVEIALLACFCTIHIHGFDMLFSFSAIVQHCPSPPVGFSILKAGLNKSVLLSVYASRNGRCRQGHSSSERRIALFLSAIGQKFLSIYRSCGTSIAFLTILLTVYLVKPNYISFGYIFILLIWITGRQLVEKTNRRLWFPLKAYSVAVFLFIYSLNTFSSLEKWLLGLLDLQFYLGYNSEASLLVNVWQSLAVMIVMQLYSYERRQSKYSQLGGPKLESGPLGFIKRFLIWHSNKILYITLFYASLSPISLFGFLYLVGLIICSLLPKSSRVPSKLFLVYTGLLVITEYLFQMWGMQAGMFPGQKHSDLAVLLGFQLFGSGFWGLEFGLRGKVLVIAACTLQYNVFRWLEKIPPSMSGKEKWEEPCPLFVSSEEDFTNFSIHNGENKWEGVMSSSSLSAASGNNRASGDVSGVRKYSLRYIWGSSQESHKWNKKRILTLRSERFEAQKLIIKVYLKFWIENMFNLFGLEINMIALLLASFALLNAVSLLYIGLLAACVLLSRPLIRKMWPLYVFMFASILVLEYFAIWKNALYPHPVIPRDADVHCRDCPESSKYLQFCESCWLGLVVDDSRVLISYFAVFMCACLKLRADSLSSFSGSHTYRQVISQRKNIFLWRDLSFETKSMWTILDYLRLYCYCHLLDLVLALILITGTLEYDILHLGYLAFAMVFFRMRLEMLKKRNKVFRFLRMYNFAVIVLSLAYQSPFVGDFSGRKRDTINYIFEVIGFHKYDYGFRITARSALVEIIIFILVSLQSFMFSSQEFDYVSRYLEAEQIGAIVREQEKKAAWKTSQLQHIREVEDKKRQRNMQVEKMKSEMLNLQIQLHDSNSHIECVDNSLDNNKGLRRRSVTSTDINARMLVKGEVGSRKRQHVSKEEETACSFESFHSPVSTTSESPPPCEITEIEEDYGDSFLSKLDKQEKVKEQSRENPIISAVQLIGDGVSQVQSIGNQAVNNLVNFLNIKPEETDIHENKCLEDGKYDEMESQRRHSPVNRSSSMQSDISSDAASLQLGRILSHIWAQMQSNNDVVCYCCFVLVFLWNFSLLSMVYLASLFMYALCVHTGPSYVFWIIMLIYTEIYILLQYLYQIIIQHHVWSSDTSLLQELGFPQHRIKSSFVMGTMPLFLVYLFTLIQSSIMAKDGEWASTNGLNGCGRNRLLRNQKLQYRVVSIIKGGIRSFYWYLVSLIQGTESPPYFVQVSMDVCSWPDDGIQPARIESMINQLLQTVHDQRCRKKNPNLCPSASRVHVQSIERSPENPNVALAVFEVIYASPPDGCASPDWYRSLTPAADVAKEIHKAQTLGFVDHIRFPYAILSVIGGGKREIDLYAYIFGADLTVFFLVAMFYQSIMKNKSEFLDVSQLEDQFPKDFVFILMVIFFLIVLDRIIYLCSFAIGKVVFYLFNLILFTYFITKYAWRMGPFLPQGGGLALRAIFLAKAFSFALQAIQVRHGIPHQITLYRQFLTSEVSRVNYLGYRLYRALPFLYELRCVLDWSCTTTSLTMYDWLKLEDINASLYLVKCDAVLNRAKHKQGEKQTKMTKCCNGICLFFFLICVIWAPMLMYSSGNPTNIANPIKDASVQVDIRTVAGRLTLYETTLCEKLPWENLNTNLDLDPEGYLDAFDKTDIQLICCQSDASALWLVPEVVQLRFVQSLQWDTDMDMSFSWVLNRDRPKGKELVRYERFVDPLDLPERSDVVKVLNGTLNSFRIYDVYPRYFRVTGSGEVRPLEQEVNAVSADLVLNHGEFQWWSFHDVNSSDVSGCGGLTGPMAIIVSEETPPQGILGDTLSKFSIWGLYITFVLAVGRFFRLQFSDLRMRIPYENLPSCDRLIAICEDIYSARAEGEFGVEEVLYWTLVKIYRSPHMLLEYTKAE